MLASFFVLLFHHFFIDHFRIGKRMEEMDVELGYYGTGMSEQSYHAWRHELARRCAASRRVRYVPREFGAWRNGMSNWSGHPVGSPGWVAHHFWSLY